jgi:RimJ/RimL family protein N-acetyltransferase
LLQYAFDRMGLQKVKLRTFSHNERARRAFRAAGFREVGRLDLGGGKEDVVMEITREEWLEALRSRRD